MRIAMVTDSYYPTRDGVVTSITTAKTALEALGHEVFVIAPDPGEDDRIDGVSYFPAVKFKSYDGYFLPLLPSNKIEILEKLNVDVIHIHGIAVMALKAMFAARSMHKPLVLTFHTMVNDTMKYYSPVRMPAEMAERLVWIYLRNLLKRPEAVITPTRSIADELLENRVVPRELRVISTGIDIDRFNPSVDGSGIRERYGLVGKKVIVHVGRISYEKNIDLVVDALSMLEDAVLMIVGKGPAEESVRHHVEEKGLDDRVIFTGFVDDSELPQFYAASDVAVSASRFETQGLSILEAMGCGIPVVCNNARAFRDFVRDGENGYLFDDTAEGLAEGIGKCLAGDIDGDCARHTAESFSIDKCAAELVHLYEDAIESKKRRMEGN